MKKMRKNEGIAPDIRFHHVSDLDIALSLSWPIATNIYMITEYGLGILLEI